MLFRQYANSFPFVSLRHEAEATSMVNQRPMSTLAICVVTCTRPPELQRCLVEAFRRALSTKVIMEGRQSLDILVGLLIYLAWHQDYSDRAPIYQLTCLLAGLAADAGYYRQPGEDAEDAIDAVERDRAFLGCYTLSSGLSTTGFDKPSPLRWTNSLRLRAARLANLGALTSDVTLISTTELTHVLGSLQTDLGAFGVTNTPASIDKTKLYIQATQARLEALQRDHPGLGRSLAFSAAKVHLHRYLLTSTNGADTSTLIDSACAIKEYLDDILARPPLTLHQMAIVDWTTLLDVLAVMGEILRPLCEQKGWEPGAITSMLQPGDLLDALCRHMAAVPAGDPLVPRHEDRLAALQGICNGVKQRMPDDGTLAGKRVVQGEGAVTGHGHPPPGGGTFEGRFRAINEGGMNVGTRPLDLGRAGTSQQQRQGGVPDGYT